MRAMNDPLTDRASSLSVSIVLYHSSLALLRDTLTSLSHAIAVARGAGLLDKARIHLIDHSCDPAYADQLARLDTELAALPEPCARLITTSDRNTGFGAGHNQALLAATSDLHLVLNPDVELAEDALSAGIVALREDRQRVLVSPRSESPAGGQEYLCKRYPSVAVLLLRAFAPTRVRRRFATALDAYEYRDLCALEQPFPAELASGCFMLARTTALREAGGFDEDFFVYFEDFDLSLRLASQGRIEYLPSMRIVHHGGYAARKGLRHIWLFLSGGIRFFNRHGWRWI